VARTSVPASKIAKKTLNAKKIAVENLFAIAERDAGPLANNFLNKFKFI
jgi:hypothetical protein